MKTIVIGATGLVGKIIVDKLLSDHDVTTFSRRSMGINHPRLTEKIVDFEKIPEWSHLIQGDVLFSALGTTLKDAGSKERQYVIDHDYQLAVAKAASQNQVKSFVLISSVNADPKSPFFYLRMKGELETAVSALHFHSLSILRPGPLKGQREKTRPSELIYTGFLQLMPKVLAPPGLYPVGGEKVATKAVNAGVEGRPGINIIGPREILHTVI